MLPRDRHHVGVGERRDSGSSQSGGATTSSSVAHEDRAARRGKPGVARVGEPRAAARPRATTLGKRLATGRATPRPGGCRRRGSRRAAGGSWARSDAQAAPQLVGAVVASRTTIDTDSVWSGRSACALSIATPRARLAIRIPGRVADRVAELPPPTAWRAFQMSTLPMRSGPRSTKTRTRGYADTSSIAAAAGARRRSGRRWASRRSRARSGRRGALGDRGPRGWRPPPARGRVSLRARRTIPSTPRAIRSRGNCPGRTNDASRRRTFQYRQPPQAEAHERGPLVAPVDGGSDEVGVEPDAVVRELRPQPCVRAAVAMPHERAGS